MVGGGACASLSRLGYFGGSQAEGVAGRREPVPAAAVRVLQRRNPGPRLCNADRRFWICAGRRFAGWRIVGDNDPIGVKEGSKLNSQDWDLGFLPGPTGRGPYDRSG
jgi:hypothetical protein